MRSVSFLFPVLTPPTNIMKMSKVIRALHYCVLLGVLFLFHQSVAQADSAKIGFVVKQPEEPWFQDEGRFAEQAAKEKNFAIVKIGGENGEKVMSAIDKLASQQAQGFIICVPDVKLGSAVVAKAAADHLKLMTVDDQLVDGKGKPLSSVPHMGISAYEIGKQVGQAIVDEIKKRGWNMQEVGAIRVTYEQLPRAHDRVTGATDVLTAAGFPRENIIDAPQAKTDTENAFNAADIAITKNPRFQKWVSFGLNDEAVLGTVRAAEGRGFGADKMIGVGIGGGKTALHEVNKTTVNGFFCSAFFCPQKHSQRNSIDIYHCLTHKQ